MMRTTRGWTQMGAIRTALDEEIVQRKNRSRDSGSTVGSVISGRALRIGMPLLMILGVSGCGAPAMDETSEPFSSEVDVPADFGKQLQALDNDLSLGATGKDVQT